MDGGERKRRKVGSEEGGRDRGGDGEEEVEEEKMEKFFALIRSTKDVLQSVARESRERARMDEAERVRKEATAWIPRFQPEDFDDKFLSGSVPGVQAGPSNSKEEEEDDGKAEREKPKEDNHLDLNLSL
ncbi:hypothetical protein BT93_A1452 [Corymbia citriodora subsp. variegata]|nr:hypothetical protein BT93_A1452 [Corymbia citriodora subsp. variegata]